MSAYDDIVPFSPATPKEVEITQKNRSILEARRLLEEQLALAAAKVLVTLLDGLDDNDPQVRLSSARELFSRLLPKVAAKQVEDAADIIDSADTANLRESILAEIKRKRDGNG